MCIILLIMLFFIIDIDVILFKILRELKGKCKGG